MVRSPQLRHRHLHHHLLHGLGTAVHGLHAAIQQRGPVLNVRRNGDDVIQRSVQRQRQPLAQADVPNMVVNNTIGF